MTRLLPALKENVRHDDDQVRRAVINVLVGRRTLLSRMAADLEPLLTAENSAVARDAAYLLGRIGPDAAPALLDALHHEKSRIDPIADARAHRAAIGGPAAQALKAPAPRVRRGAALALGQMRPLAPGTVQNLSAGLHDADTAVKAAVLTAIGLVGSRANDAVPAVRALLSDKSAEIRVQAIHVLSQSAPRDERRSVS